MSLDTISENVNSPLDVYQFEGCIITRKEQTFKVQTQFTIYLYLHGGLGLAQRHQLHRDLVHLCQPHLVGLQVGLKVVNLLLYHLNLLEIIRDVLKRRENTYSNTKITSRFHVDKLETQTVKVKNCHLTVKSDGQSRGRFSI